MKIFKLFLLLTVGLFISCGDDGGGSSGTLTLSADFTTRFVGETTTFTVMNSDDENVTSSSSITVNGNAITGNTFSPTSAGSYSVVATKNGVTSNTVIVTYNPASIPVTSITLSSNKTSAGVGENIIFSVIGNNGANLSPQSTINFNGTAQTGFNIIMTAAGTFNVTATYVNSQNVTLTSNALVVNAVEIIKFNKRVLIEDFTGTWCGWCPRVSHAINLVKAQTNDVEIVAIHQGNDPYNISTSPYSVSGYPTAKLNRGNEWTYPEPENVAEAVNLTTGTNPKLGLAMNSSLSGNTLNLDVKVKFGYNFNNLKLIVYVLEDGLIYNQTNYTSYFGGGSTIANFQHDHVLRSVLTNIMGDNITGSTNSGETYTRNFSVNLPSSISNSNNVTVTAVVVDNLGKAVNVRTTDLGVNQAFEVED